MATLHSQATAAAAALHSSPGGDRSGGERRVLAHCCSCHQGRRWRLGNAACGGGGCCCVVGAEGSDPDVRRCDLLIPLLGAISAALSKSLAACACGGGGECLALPSVDDIGWPTELRHVAHVTFDCFGGFVGLPEEIHDDLPLWVPSSSASVFGVPVNCLHCSYDGRGNSVPTILLLMQRHLYFQGGLQAEGIFRINAEDGHQAYVREHLNSGIVPREIDIHCLASLIKAWFRELPDAVLDSIPPDQIMHCNTEDESCRLVQMLPRAKAALLDWAINLMADVAEREHHNKMSARNIAMVFAPNMTQMADPLSGLIHAIQVMNLLRTLISRVLRERESILLLKPCHSVAYGRIMADSL